MVRCEGCGGMILVTDDPAVYIEWHLTVLAWTVGAAIILTGVIGSIWAMWKAWQDWKEGR